MVQKMNKDVQGGVASHSWNWLNKMRRGGGGGGYRVDVGLVSSGKDTERKLWYCRTVSHCRTFRMPSVAFHTPFEEEADD